MNYLIKNAVRLGNGAGVLLPKDWLGSEVKVTLIERPINIQQDILRILQPILKDIIGVYLTGSYARGEQRKDSDIDMLVITENINKIINSGKYNIILVSLDNVKKTLEKNIITLYPLIKEAKVIINRQLLEELKKTEITKDKLKWHIDTTKSALKIVRSLLNLEKKEYLEDTAVIYSLVLRLREAYIVDCLLKNKNYYTKDLMKILEKELGKENAEKMYDVYKAERDNKKIKIEINKNDSEKLYKLVERMIHGK